MCMVLGMLGLGFDSVCGLFLMLLLGMVLGTGICGFRISFVIFLGSFVITYFVFVMYNVFVLVYKCFVLLCVLYRLIFVF